MFKKIKLFKVISIRYWVLLSIIILSGITNYILGFTYLLICLLQIITALFSVIFIIDNKQYIIPDTINLLLFLIGIFVYIYSRKINILKIYNYERNVALIVSIFILLITIFFDKILKKEILGYGDIKLFIAISLIFGVKHLLMGIFIAAFIACIIEIVFLKCKRNPIAFGPYLVIGFLISFYFEIINAFI